VNSSASLKGISKPVSKVALSTTGSVPQEGVVAAASVGAVVTSATGASVAASVASTTGVAVAAGLHAAKSIILIRSKPSTFINFLFIFFSFWFF